MAIHSDESEQPTRADVWAMRKKAIAKPWKDITVVQSWPRPRGRVKSARQQAWVDRFSLWACLTKSPDAQTYDQAKEWADDSGWFWRDVLTSALAGKLVETIGETRITTPTASLTRATNQTIASGADVVLTPTAEEWDNNTFWSAAVTPTRMIFRSPGLYLVGFTAVFTASQTRRVSAWMRANGTRNLGRALVQTSSNGDVHLTGAAVYYFRAQEYLELLARTTFNNDTVQIAQWWTVAITPEAIIP